MKPYINMTFLESHFVVHSADNQNLKFIDDQVKPME